MLILGIDPGTATTGFGLIEKNDGEDFKILDWGLIETNKETKPHIRLHEIHEQMHMILTKFKPNVLVMEKVFFSNNAKTVIRVGQAQGVILLASAGYTLEVFEYAPGTIKKLVTGDGRANKKLVEKHVYDILGKKLEGLSLKDGHGKERKMTKTYIDNAIDALAIAMCHLISLHEAVLPPLQKTNVKDVQKKKKKNK